MSRFLILFILLFSAMFAAGQGSSELPSAPSAVLKQRNQPDQATPPAQSSDPQPNTATQSPASTTTGTSASGATETQTPANSGTNQVPQQNGGSAPASDTSAKQNSQAGSKSDDEAATTI